MKKLFKTYIKYLKALANKMKVVIHKTFLLNNEFLQKFLNLPSKSKKKYYPNMFEMAAAKFKYNTAIFSNGIREAAYASEYKFCGIIREDSLSVWGRGKYNITDISFGDESSCILVDKYFTNLPENIQRFLINYSQCHIKYNDMNDDFIYGDMTEIYGAEYVYKSLVWIYRHLHCVDREDFKETIMLIRAEMIGALE